MLKTFITILFVSFLLSFKDEEAEYYPYVEDGPIGGRKKAEKVQILAIGELYKLDEYSITDTLIVTESNSFSNNRLHQELDIIFSSMGEQPDRNSLDHTSYYLNGVNVDSLRALFVDIEKKGNKTKTAKNRFNAYPKLPNNYMNFVDGESTFLGNVTRKGGNAIAAIDTVYFDSDLKFGRTIRYIILDIEQQ